MYLIAVLLIDCFGHGVEVVSDGLEAEWISRLDQWQVRIFMVEVADYEI